MLAQQRQAAILDRIRRSGGVKVADLVTEFGVSDMTVRRDLEALAERGLLAKVHGGATALLPGSTDEPGFAAKSVRQRAEKAAIAARAAELVTSGMAVALSAGTTTAELAHRLVGVPDLTVVTNSIPVADVFFRAGQSYQDGQPAGTGRPVGTGRPAGTGRSCPAGPVHRPQTVVLTGGVRTPSDALVGPVAVATIRSLHLDVLFLGVHGMSERAGYTTPNLMEADTDRALVAAAERLVVLADHTKWGTVGISSIAALDAAQVLITDAGLPGAARRVLVEQVAELVVVDPPPGSVTP